MALVLYGLSKLYAYYHTGSNLDIYDKESVLFLDAPATIKWMKDDSEITGEFSKYLRKEIGQVYAKACQTKNLSEYHNSDLGLSDYFTEDLLEKVKYSRSKNNTSIHSEVLTHNLQLHFISFDKQIISFSDWGRISTHKIIQSDYGHSYTDTSDYKVLMILEDGDWKISHLHKM